MIDPRLPENSRLFETTYRQMGRYSHELTKTIFSIVELNTTFF